MNPDLIAAVNALLDIARRHEPVQAAAIQALLRRVEADGKKTCASD